jgi:hypothetical protein
MEKAEFATGAFSTIDVQKPPKFRAMMRPFIKTQIASYLTFFSFLFLKHRFLHSAFQKSRRSNLKSILLR